MYSISNLRVGVAIEYNSDPYVILASQHVKIGRGGGMQKVKMKNLNTGTNLEVTFKGADRITPAQIDYLQAQYLYTTEGDVFFMDQTTFEQFSIKESDLTDRAKYLKEGEPYKVSMYKGSPIDLELPIKVKYKVVEAETGLKGDSTTSPTKTIVLEGGLKIQAPIFIKEGEEILVDTRDGSYVSRA